MSRRTKDSSADIDHRSYEKRQEQGRTIGSLLYMLIRSVKIHAPDNAIFLKPVEALREAVNGVLAMDRRFDLQCVESTFFLNDSPIKFDFAFLECARYVTAECEAHDVGGFWVAHPVTSADIRRFIGVFGKDTDKREEYEDPKQPLPIRLLRVLKVREILDQVQGSRIFLSDKIDRKKYLMIVYARAVVFMRRFLGAAATNTDGVPMSKGARIVQDFIDLCHEHRSHFLGMTHSRNEEEYLIYHSVNCCLLAIVFGAELGLSKSQRHDLGMAALFSQIGLASVPGRIMRESGPLAAEDRKLIDLYPVRSAKDILKARGLDRATMRRMVASYESKVDYSIPQRQADGTLELLVPGVEIGVPGRIIAIVDCYDALTSRRPFRDAYGPEVALALMAGEIKYKFDPVLLRIFMRVMAIQPIKILDPKNVQARGPTPKLCA